MTDEQQGGIGCLVILLIIGGCCLVSNTDSTNGPGEEAPPPDPNQLMDEIIDRAQEEARIKIERLESDFAVQRQEREDLFAAESARLLNLMEIDRTKDETAKRMERERDSKEDELRSFALKESPGVWKTLQTLSAEQDTLTSRIENLEQTLRRFGEDPETDQDVARLRAFREKLEEQIELVSKSLVAAYLASKKYEAMPHRKDFNDLMRKSIEEGISAAEMAERRYKELKEKGIGL